METIKNGVKFFIVSIILNCIYYAVCYLITLIVTPGYWYFGAVLTCIFCGLCFMVVEGKDYEVAELRGWFSKYIFYYTIIITIPINTFVLYQLKLPLLSQYDFVISCGIFGPFLAIIFIELMIAVYIVLFLVKISWKIATA